jgi:hypothetical protein
MAQPPPSLPIHVRRTIGPSWGMIGGVVAIVAVVLWLRLPTDGSAAEVMLHGPGLAYLAVPLLAGAVLAALRTPGELDIDEAGVVMTARRKRHVYAWRDIVGAVPLRRGVQMMMRDQDFEASKLNVIPSAFGIAPHALHELIDQGRERWGGDATAQPRYRSSIPSHDPWAARRHDLLRSLAVVAAVSAVIIAVVIAAQAGVAVKTSRLVQAGVRTEARVVRLYTGVCSRSGCELRAHYSFQPASGPFAGRTIDGYDTLAYDRGDAKYLSARSTGHVPIVYDPARPSLSALNFQDFVFHRNVLGDTLGIVAILGGVVGFFMAVLVWAAWRRTGRSPDQRRRRRA